MADVVVSAFGGGESDSEVDSDGGSQDEEGDVLDDEPRSVDSDSTGSLADFIAPDWDMADGEGFLAVEDNDDDDDDDDDGDYSDGGDDSDDDDDDDNRDDDDDDNRDDDDDDNRDDDDDDDDRDDDDGRDDGRLKRACSPDTGDAPSRFSSPVGRLRDTTPRLEILLYRLRRLAREFEPETDQSAVLHHRRPRYCTRRRGRRTTWVPPPLRRAGGSLVMAPHNNAESDASPLSPNWRRRRRRARGPLVD
ncbi:hypothetical protein LEL_10922 [Akanthomyces lecanii RCEF 1005]|uniref:Uncharacterized protein n=1 Tax=Akanthomyces lecanii RCEF 1005 TaxID=1081108 RepID=A0A167Q6N1_CORDF|nr:hypothetical protein LEL_10922 [Akanthomyces lecanii RCEF 1005]